MNRTAVWPDIGVKMFPKVAQIDATAVFPLSDTFQKSPKSHQCFCKQNCCQELSKIAQSGHTE